METISTLRIGDGGDTSFSRGGSWAVLAEWVNEAGPTPDTRERITGGVRSNIVDIVKGIAIILVVYGHTAQGMTHRGWWVSPGASFSHIFVYSFHMPAFFFVAGLFVTGSIAKRGSRRFAIDKLKTILYPYVLLAVLTVALEPLIGRYKFQAKPFRWNVFLVDLADGQSSWFLFVLFFCLMLALVTIRMPALLRFAIATVAGIIGPAAIPGVSQVLHEFCFLAAGMWAGHRIYRLERIRLSAAALGFVLLTALQVVAVNLFGVSVLGGWMYIEAGLAGVAGLFFLARMLDNHAIGHCFAWVGRASLAIFLLSAFAQGATRELLLWAFPTHEFWLQLLLPTLFATLLPAIVWYQQRRWHVGWLFRWPALIDETDRTFTAR